MDWLRPGVRTVFERVPGYTACVDDPVDRGADASTFAMIRALRDDGVPRRRGVVAWATLLPAAEDDPHATSAFVVADHDYRWASQVDASGLTQVLGLWRAGRRRRSDLVEHHPHRLRPPRRRSLLGRSRARRCATPTPGSGCGWTWWRPAGCSTTPWSC